MINILDLQNFKNEEGNCNIYSVELQIGNIYNKYSGKFIESLEHAHDFSNPIIGYIYNEKNCHQYFIYGHKETLVDTLDLKLISQDSKYSNLNLFYKKTNDKYIEFKYNNDKYNIKEFNLEEYNPKTSDIIKRKFLNNVYLSNNN